MWGVEMNILDALQRIPRCWEISTGEKFDMNSIVSIEIGERDTIFFELKDGRMYRIRFRVSHFIEKYRVYGGKGEYKRV